MVRTPASDPDPDPSSRPYALTVREVAEEYLVHLNLVGTELVVDGGHVGRCEAEDLHALLVVVVHGHYARTEGALHRGGLEVRELVALLPAPRAVGGARLVLCLVREAGRVIEAPGAKVRPPEGVGEVGEGLHLGRIGGVRAHGREGITQGELVSVLIGHGGGVSEHVEVVKVPHIGRAASEGSGEG